MSVVNSMVGAWSAGIDAEIKFWRRWAATGGSEWPDEFRRRLDPLAALDTRLGELARGNGTVARILDVGAGPLTVLGKRYLDISLDIVACDPLAGAYRRILEDYNVAPLVPTEFAIVEDLSCFFESSSFDIVFCQNALDHSFDPCRGILEMLRVVKPGGHVVLRHARNEAVHENYVGFHQFNFDVRDERFLIWSPGGEAFLSDFVTIDYVETTVAAPPNNVEVILQKKSEFPIGEFNPVLRPRIAQIYQGVVDFFAERGLAVNT
jgi:SAM-dependent methyltransferase